MDLSRQTSLHVIDHDDGLRRALARAIVAGRLDQTTALENPIVREFARDEGVLPLLAWMGDRRDRVLRVQAAVQLARRARLSRLLELLAAEGIGAIVFKGAHLAYTCYPDPATRPHVDTDLLIHPRDIDATRGVFERSGHRHLPHVSGRFVMSQFHYVDGSAGGAHAYDVHWRIANPAVFRDVLSFDVVRGQASSLDVFGTRAVAPSIPHALLIACIHRAAHHAGGDRLIWLNDVRLLLQKASRAQLDEFCDLADTAGVNAVCHDACARAADLFGDVTVPARLATNARNTTEPTAAYVSERSALRQLWWDLRALPWRDRGSLVREHLFPPASYIQNISPGSGPIVVQYVTRIVRGGTAWVRAALSR